jgi:magnesium-transporting ATPase (P-type)
VLVITLLFIRNLFGFVYGVVFGLAMGAIGLFLPLAVNDFILKYIGLTSMLYAIFDIKDDLISRNIAESDASRMGQMLFGNSLFWGVIWIVIAGVAAFFILKSAAKGEELERKW